MNRLQTAAIVIAVALSGCAGTPEETREAPEHPGEMEATEAEAGAAEALDALEAANDVGSLKVFCKKPEHGVVCSQKCYARNIPCVYGALHPHKQNEPAGLLYACNKLTPGFMCSYTYQNGDACHFPFGRPGLALCLYTGGVE
jgi:hypothetical protein